MQLLDVLLIFCVTVVVNRTCYSSIFTIFYTTHFGKRAPTYASDMAVAERGEVYCPQHGVSHFQSGGCVSLNESLKFLQGSLDSLVRATPKKTIKITSG